ncbi:hypothetical protein BOX15_Mlig009438g2 [Macrostomum lignano]|uniref:Uncharacterized protein n=1 Tax=Macrostomum lignano TaxID=282301 RepID=A0A267G4L6_9PLAT|nr:hypothetical protein BOX15_Mlig009438g2 [Macrostomum lignano]
MPPWTDRLMTKIRKLYVVRLLMPNGAEPGPSTSGVGGGFYRTGRFAGTGVAGHQKQSSAGVPRRRRLKYLRQSSDGVESVTNSQSVPESARGADASNGVAVLSVPTSQDSGESYYSVRNSSANDASCSDSSDSTVVNCSQRACRHTPRMRISESSKVCSDTAKQQQHQKQLTSARSSYHMKARKLRHRQHFVETDEPEMSVPASCTVPINRHGASSKLIVSSPAKPVAADAVSREAGQKKELLFAVVVDDEAVNSAGAEDAAAAAAVAIATGASAPSTKKPADSRSVKRTRDSVVICSLSSGHNSEQKLHLSLDSSSVSSAPPGTATKVVEFNVARQAAGVATSASPASSEYSDVKSQFQAPTKPPKTRVLVAKRCLRLWGPGSSYIENSSRQSSLETSTSTSSSSSSTCSASVNSASTGFTCAVSTKIAENGRQYPSRGRTLKPDYRQRKRRQHSANRRRSVGVDRPAYSRTVEWSDRLVS